MELGKARIFCVSPAFRLIALALPPSRSGKNAWLVDEIVAMFHFHTLPHAKEHVWGILQSLFPNLADEGVLSRLQRLSEILASYDVEHYGEYGHRPSVKTTNKSYLTFSPYFYLCLSVV